METTETVPLRSQIPPADCWDLASLFSSDEAWEQAFVAWEQQIGGYAAFRGRLGESAQVLADALAFDTELDRAGERLGTYAFLKAAEDTTNSVYQRMQGRHLNAASRASQAASYLRPEILALSEATVASYLADARLAPYRLLLERLLREKPHTLSEREERLLAMQTEMAQTANQVFGQLNDADLKFGVVTDDQGRQVELSHATFQTLLHSPSRDVRRGAFHQYYRQYDAHRHTLAATLAGAIQRDVYYARAREFGSSLEAALFPDNVPVAVYENLIAAVRRHLPALHRYYEVRRRKMGLPDLHHYDTYVPILADLESHRTWDEAVELVVEALAPLGSDYCGVLERGLRGRWCDRYENRGKHSGAFSAGSFDGDPYILMNYQPKVLDQVFTLAHEAGHSMHSYYSARSQPYQYYNYTIFVAEVASTFNEELLSRHLMNQAPDDRHRAYLVNRQIDAMRATIFRQTMFAEFEKLTHELAEANEPLTIDRFQEVYRGLLTTYFGPEFTLDDELSLECLRIPHFYRAFYVYKYATGMSAAIALADRVLHGGERELGEYLGFLRGGSSKWPLDLLRDAGVDMGQPGPIDTALDYFARLVDELDALL
ncbi:MAG: oligoendopeptidase F [Thermoguttaceae bacterium]|jgi:oligoendopeptidase F|nr:oligoendopeptidase F [Thermoguttaceae bacterium]